MRLFVAVWPPPDVVEVLSALAKPALRTVRWTDPARYHVTLRFLGHVDDPERAVACMEELDARAVAAPHAVVGPATQWMARRQVLCVPVSGLDELAGAVAVSLDEFGGEDRPFAGHLTLARTRGNARGPRFLAGTPLSAIWPVGAVTLVSSALSESGPRYEVLTQVALSST